MSLGPSGVTVGSSADESSLEAATFTLSEEPCADRRVVTVDSVPETLAELTARCERWPHASAVCDDVLRAIDPAGATLAGVITESLAYSTLQAGPEFARWLDERGPASVPVIADPVVADRDDDDILHIKFNRSQRHNAFSTDARAALLEALAVAQLDPSVTGIVLSGNGPSFCSGGDLAEFGTFADPAGAHLARTRHSPALVLDALAVRFGRACRARVHGRVMGSGLEMAAFCGWVEAQPAARTAQNSQQMFFIGFIGQSIAAAAPPGQCGRQSRIFCGHNYSVWNSGLDCRQLQVVTT